MARIRTIKPEFFKSDELADLSPLHRLLFIGLWCLADRDGRLEDKPRRIKVEILPYDDADVDAMLADLHAAGFVHRYTAEGVACIVVVNFEKHQRITGKESEQRSSLPAPDGGNNGETPGKHPGAQEGKGREEEGKDPPSRAHAHEGSRLRTVPKVDPIFGVANGEGWQFQQADLAVLVEAGERIGVLADELPHKIGRMLMRRHDGSVERWYAMEPALVALWCRKAVTTAVHQKGPQGESLCSYVAGIIAPRLLADSNFLEEGGKVTSIHRERGGPAAEEKRAAIEQSSRNMAAKGLFDVI